MNIDDVFLKNMFSKNSLPLGMLYGFIPSLLVWLLCNYILNNEAFVMDKPAAPYLIAICLNLLLLRYAAKKHLDEMSRGIMLITFVCMLLVFIFKMQAR
ncbi:hypothetical protein [Mucilaginibacter glaciei]|uniref:Stationary phase survival protein SurE n=1 Tax=Mucilaginibacter glaciei TaxID=2772109 RepID=A0A926NWA3_9SPHI|nr:hypothetical protein [Mucilaginibacter glaciei]MBD1392983.1 hypothetical protein [Mucilaginibacter glaciei]